MGETEEELRRLKDEKSRVLLKYVLINIAVFGRTS
jgi:hypothetical protein